ncbi:ABC transporter substrate-binding protein [Clavibacter michiganensis]|uniref:ABC transporter substrate-binding protein n=1 Tax=Clavibacter michiganensis TaxID=28447 RepID=UPI0006913B95|nr:ABC transporter substrate-binding protein [Clavibacter michiganensis]
MTNTARTRVAAGIAGAAVIALLATGCTSGGAGGSDGGDITLTVTTFNKMGFDELYAQYEESHPGITIKATNIDTGGNALVDWQTKQASGAGLPDVQAVEEGWLSKVMQVSDSFTDLRDHGIEDVKDRWVPWKYDQATDPEGRVIGYGTDIGPEGLCYNSKLFAEAGLPTDRTEVAALFGGEDATWDRYFEVGKQYKEATGKSWYDQSGFIWNAMVNQQPEGYYTKDGELNVEGNADLEALWQKVADGAEAGLSDAQTAWDWGGGKAFTDGSFATFVCPGWMLGTLQGNAESAGGDATTGWDFADVFPGGSANWGGSFLTVPASSEHPAEAAELAAWLTEPEQQTAAFQAAGTFPSTIEAQGSEGVTGQSELTAFFNDAPLGTMLSARAQGVEAQYKGPDDSVIQEQVFGPSIQALDAGKSDGQRSWDDAITLLGQLVEQ